MNTKTITNLFTLFGSAAAADVAMNDEICKGTRIAAGLTAAIGVGTLYAANKEEITEFVKSDAVQYTAKLMMTEMVNECDNNVKLKDI